jgi:hypothetical protein
LYGAIHRRDGNPCSLICYRVAGPRRTSDCGGDVANVANADYELGFELYEILPDAILAVDQQGVIRYANHQAG